MPDRVNVRMYRQGLGDCFLLSFPTADGGCYRVMIDCGVILGQPSGAENMRRVVANIAEESKGEIDLLVATHEHWDHISGFVQAWEAGQNGNRGGLPGLSFKELWLAWTEDPVDAQAKRLAARRDAALVALSEAALHLALAASPLLSELAPFVEQLGLTAAARTPDAMANIKSVTTNVRYCRPTDDPRRLPGTNVRVFTLAPPLDEKLLHTLSKSSGNPIMYGLDAPSNAVTIDGRPFGNAQTLPLEAARQLPFFKKYYFGTDVVENSDDAPARRRIDDAWLGSTSDLALQLDAYTNNTSLVLCFQFEDGDTMLFPGDAQIGSWLSWPTLSWTLGEEVITGAELLERCTLYKVGHHGSHNATARENGLELMTNVKTAIIPVDEAEAKRKRWNRMPLPAILDALNERTGMQIVRADDEPANRDEDLYVDVRI